MAKYEGSDRKVGDCNFALLGYNHSISRFGLIVGYNVEHRGPSLPELMKCDAIYTTYVLDTTELLHFNYILDTKYSKAGIATCKNDFGKSILPDVAAINWDCQSNFRNVSDLSGNSKAIAIIARIILEHNNQMAKESKILKSTIKVRSGFCNTLLQT